MSVNSSLLNVSEGNEKMKQYRDEMSKDSPGSKEDFEEEKTEVGRISRLCNWSHS